jgi:hypothetical protein
MQNKKKKKKKKGKKKKHNVSTTATCNTSTNKMMKKQERKITSVQLTTMASAARSAKTDATITAKIKFRDIVVDANIYQK